MARLSARTVSLVDLEVIVRYSLAIRQETAPAEEVLAALDDSRALVLALLEGRELPDEEDDSRKEIEAAERIEQRREARRQRQDQTKGVRPPDDVIAAVAEAKAPEAPARAQDDEEAAVAAEFAQFRQDRQARREERARRDEADTPERSPRPKQGTRHQRPPRSEHPPPVDDFSRDPEGPAPLPADEAARRREERRRRRVEMEGGPA